MSDYLDQMDDCLKSTQFLDRFAKACSASVDEMPMVGLMLGPLCEEFCNRIYRQLVGVEHFDTITSHDP